MTSLLDEFFKKSKNNQTDAEMITTGDRSQFDGEIKFKATIHGRVQGVGFRFTTNQLAQELDIRGIVRNESDGTVYVEAVGAEEQIDTFIKRLAQGPSPQPMSIKSTFILTIRLKITNDSHKLIEN